MNTLSSRPWLCLAWLLILASPVLAQDPVAGRDYFSLSRPIPVAKPGRQEVRFFFWYGCPHCYRLNPHLEGWLKSRPADVSFIRTPVAINPVWEIAARGFYVAQHHRVAEQSNTAMFDAIQKQGQKLFSRDALARFYQGYGIDPGDFNAEYGSHEISVRVRNGDRLARKAGADGVPAIIVDGKYRVNGETAKVIDTVNFLLARDHLEAANRR